MHWQLAMEQHEDLAKLLVSRTELLPNENIENLPFQAERPLSSTVFILILVVYCAESAPSQPVAG